MRMELDHDFDIFAFKDDTRQSPSQPGKFRISVTHQNTLRLKSGINQTFLLTSYKTLDTFQNILVIFVRFS